MKRIIKNIITSPAFRRLLHFTDKSIGTILMLHRVDDIDPSRLSINENLKVSPEFLDSLILRFRKNGFSFVSIDELHESLIKNRSAGQLVVFTLDDGYNDNYENAFPVFKRHSVPFTIYIATAFPEKRMIFWWYILEDIILRNEKIVLDDGESYNCERMEDKEAAFLELRKRIITSDPYAYAESLPGLFSNYSFDIKKYQDYLPLSWEKILLLSKDPLFTLGNHTHSHGALKSSSKKRIKMEIDKSNQLFEKHLKIKPRHFSYPFGDSFSFSEKETAYISEMGFETAVTTNAGNIYGRHINQLYRLPRIFISEFHSQDIVQILPLMKLKRR